LQGVARQGSKNLANMKIKESEMIFVARQEVDNYVYFVCFEVYGDMIMTVFEDVSYDYVTLQAERHLALNPELKIIDLT
jgi:hypothetical protein